MVNIFLPTFNASAGWLNNATLGVAGPIIVDGAKRDRAVWPGNVKGHFSHSDTVLIHMYCKATWVSRFLRSSYLRTT